MRLAAGYCSLLVTLLLFVTSSLRHHRGGHGWSVEGSVLRHSRQDNYRRHQMIHSAGPRTRHSRRQTDEQTRIVKVLIDMQKKTEELEHVEHTADEEDEVSDLIEGDIALTLDQAQQLVRDLSSQRRRRRRRKLAEPLAKRWRLPIPYMFDGSHSHSERHRIKQALTYWEELTCVQFQENKTAHNKLLFVRGVGCWSYVGYTHQANQTVSIGDGCQSNGTIAHEVGHAIGFWHEQSRPDRDDYIFIHKTNVSRGKLYNFEPRTWGEIITMDVPYDLGSDMHYGATFYAKDSNSTTVETRDRLMARVIGQRQELSFYDVKLANKAYCNSVCSGTQLHQPCRRDGYQDPLACGRCRCPAGFGGDYCQTVAPSVNARCGGLLDGRFNGTIYSPGYPTPGYQPNVQCNWLIRAPLGSRVFLRFVGVFGVAGHLDLCRDYVEVRYNTSLALTGPRFCTDDPPRRPLVSSSNEMLVLFRSYTESQVCDDARHRWKCKLGSIGFRARYYTNSCGGCQSTSPPSQPACVRRLSYTCAQSWQEKVKIPCPNWWYSDNCGMRTVNRVRYATCHRDETYCCGRYQKDGPTCTDPGTSKQSNDSKDPPSDDVSDHSGTPRPPPRPVTVPTAPPPPLWSDWTGWGPCSRSCGGGVRVRSRRCLRSGRCGPTGIQVERSPCAQTACFRRCLVHKRILCNMWSTCTRTVYERCNPYCYDDYVLRGRAVCVPVRSH